MHLLKIKFGIFKVNVTAPNDIKHPILPIHHEGKAIYPTGTWVGWYTKH